MPPKQNCILSSGSLASLFNTYPNISNPVSYNGIKSESNESFKQMMSNSMSGMYASS
jgi:hypothetical protein